MKKILIFFLFIVSVWAEAENFIYIENINYQYIDYLINTATVVPHFIFQQPYRLFEFESIKNDDIYQRWNYLFIENKISLMAGTDNSLFYSKNERKPFYSINAGGHYISRNIILGNRFSMDKRYKYDEYYPGDLSESDDWLYGRVNDAYMDISTKRFNFFIGRIHRNWGMPSFPGLMISDNPYTYDHINLSYSSPAFRFSMLYARLEDAEEGLEYFSIDSTYQYYSNVQKHIMGHRIDLHVTDNFQMALTEMAIYGGENREFELAFANPMTFYYGLQRNEDKDMSGLWSIDLFYKPTPKISLYGQFLIDDIIINNDPSVNDRGRYPDRFAVMFSIRGGDHILKGLNWSATYVKVWNDTYQSRRTWENYHFNGLGMGYPEVACEEGYLKLEYWRKYPFYVSNEMIIGQYGTRDISDIFLLIKEEFPAKPVLKNFYNQLQIKYFWSNQMSIYFNYIYLANSDHYRNRMNVYGKHNVEVGVNFYISRAVFPFRSTK